MLQASARRFKHALGIRLVPRTVPLVPPDLVRRLMTRLRLTTRLWLRVLAAEAMPPIRETRLVPIRPGPLILVLILLDVRLLFVWVILLWPPLRGIVAATLYPERNREMVQRVQAVCWSSTTCRSLARATERTG